MITCEEINMKRWSCLGFLFNIARCGIKKLDEYHEACLNDLNENISSYNDLINKNPTITSGFEGDNTLDSLHFSWS
jgi:hypothetical protein